MMCITSIDKGRRISRRLSFLPFFLFIFLPLCLCSCGADEGRFRVEGQLQNMNQAEFYIYSPDAGFPKLDTIKVERGRFIYETDLDKLATFILIYPNGSEQVVFGNSGASVKMNGDASHLKEMEVEGTPENEEMTDWRMNANRLTPPEVKQSAIDYIKEHPASIISNYLFQRYLLLDIEPDYKKAAELIKVMMKEQPENGRLIRLDKQLQGLSHAMKGQQLPDFQATDMNGRTVSRQSLTGELNIISIWATWSYDSQSMQRRLHALKDNYGGRLALISINLDANSDDCKRFLDRDSIRWSNVCDGKMWDTPLVQQLGLSEMPGNIFVDRGGRVVDVNVPLTKIDARVRSILR